VKHKKITYLFVLVLGFLLTYAAGAADTLHVITHNKETIVTNPSNGFNEYKRWGVFPSANTPIRKIILHVKFACPDTMRCADWDYLDFISIKRVGGVKGENKDFEIGRMLTPYGGAFNKDWKFNWELDVTDFSLLLRDSVEIEYNHTGWENNKDRGWLVTLDFEIIKGKPIAEPISIQKIYGGAYKYGDSAASIETYLTPVNFVREKDAAFAKFKISQTGHGANRSDACGEFCSKKRDIVFNGNLIDTRPVWKKCGDNPLYPQAGTWIYDRANWCPGYLQIPDEYLLPIKDQNTIDVNMEPYEARPSEAVENIAAYLIQYKKATTKNDASILDIVVPANKGTYLRSNPACSNAKIIVKNNGTNNLKTLQIQYGTNDFKPKHYEWKGDLSFNQQIEIELPGAIEANKGNNYFTVTLSKPNKKTDEFSADNAMASQFTKAPVHGKELILAFKTNNQPQHNAYTLQNSDGKIVYNRQFDSSQKNTLFRDTFRLAPGCYELLVKDTGDDGLEFWASPRGGSGYVRLGGAKRNLLKQFESDFGSSIYYSFIVSDDKEQWSEVNTETAIGLYPTRTNGKTTLEFFSGKEEDVLVQIITDEGAQLVEEHQYKKIKEGSFTYDLSYRPAQRYYLKVFIGGELKFNKRIRVAG
jgi:hypothetical protein